MKQDVFGTKGDFTTSPEISQMFGEVRTISESRLCVLTGFRADDRSLVDRLLAEAR